MKKKYLIAITALFLCIAGTIKAQENREYKPVDFSLQLKNMHLWRGLQITNSAVTAVDLSLTDKTGSFKGGLWGGAGTNGEYKEFDYYFTFYKKGFTFSVWDIYNFSNGAKYNNSQAFNYNAKETGHFIDASIGYTLPASFPLNISWATVIFGRDRGSANEKNLYSSYVSLDYPVLRGGLVDVNLGIAGAFALSPEKGSDNHFYGKSPGIVNVNVVAAKTVHFGDYKVPVSVMGMWNPENNDANIQVALGLITF